VLYTALFPPPILPFKSMSRAPSRPTHSLPSRFSAESRSSLAPATGSQPFKRTRQTLNGDFEQSWKRTKWESSSESEELDPASSSEEEQNDPFDLEAYLRFRKSMEEAATGETTEERSSVCSETGHQV